MFLFLALLAQQKLCCIFSRGMPQRQGMDTLIDLDACGAAMYHSCQVTKILHETTDDKSFTDTSHSSCL